jgi:hypothetical protein
MPLSLSFSTLRFFIATFACLLVVSRVAAHEPFDISSRITIYDDRLELTSTLGADGMRGLLTSAGTSPEKIAESLRSLGPDKPVMHPVKLAAHFFQITNNGEPLAAKRISSVSEGAEILVTVVFPRPATGALVARATCYESVPGLNKGVLLIEDETNGPLNSAMLSPARPQLATTVPKKGDRSL